MSPGMKPQHPPPPHPRRHFLISTSTALTPREALGVVGDNQAAITVLTGVKGGAIGNPFLVGSVVLTWLA